jgi:release factor glutamine methyltransferase
MTQQQEQPWTVLKLLEWTTEYFKKRGSTSARLDAEVLLAHARDCQRISLYTSFAEIPTEEQRVAFRELVRRRGEGAPVAQLVGYREFYSLRLRVNDHVLTPRPETEHVVMAALDYLKALPSNSRPPQIADVGTGSGAIAVAIAKHFPIGEIMAIDQSAEALEIARWNVKNLALEDRVTLVQADLLTQTVAEPTFDLIASNPPYVSEAEYAELPVTIRNYEPREALVAGSTGTEIIERLLKQSESRIRNGGLVLIELSPMIAQACVAVAKASDRWQDVRLIKDFASLARVLALRAS